MPNIYSIFRRTYACWRTQGLVGTFRAICHKIKTRFSGRDPALSQSTQTASSQTLFDARFANLRPINVHLQRAGVHRRINLITDSVGQGSLFGGVGTALILAVRLSNELGASLRIITRTEQAKPEDIARFLALYDLQLKHELVFNFAWIGDSRYELELHRDDVVITTSWWTTASTLPNVPPRQIFYLLQEDERMFYPFGDERHLCEQTLKNPDIRFIINTELLFRHLVASGLRNIENNGFWFEPAFPASLYHPRTPTTRNRKRFFFYARPNNARNMFFLGVEVIRQAILRDILPPAEWEICFVGKDIPEELVLDETPVRCIRDLKWNDYAEFIGTVDLALSLMDTPHPSYPPLDIAASGGVVVTNQHGCKQDLSGYSRNIICSACEVDALVQGLREGVALANGSQRHDNFKNDGLSRSWNDAFEKTVRQVITGEKA